MPSQRLAKILINKNGDIIKQIIQQIMETLQTDKNGDIIKQIIQLNKMYKSQPCQHDSFIKRDCSFGNHTDHMS